MSTGFTLGGPNGATLGGPNGGTLGTDPLATRWRIADVTFRVLGAESTPEGIDVTLRVRRSQQRSAVATLEADAGNVEQRERADGTLEALDTAAGENTYTLEPAQNARPARVPRTVVVDDVSVVGESADGRSKAVEVSLLWRRTRDPEAFDGGTREIDEYEFDMETGSIVTRRVSASESSGGDVTVSFVADGEQAAQVESVTAAVAGARVETVPDGSRFARDTTPDGRQTVDVTAADGGGDVLESGEYVVTECAVSGVTPGYVASVTMHPVAE